ncbi:MAG TPA: alcohol dehydrogenase [Sphaerochaeta sp.]|nr:alcohol dehydrogenase [Sphaerochaeta sp.]
MKNFNYYQPTKILFGFGKRSEIGKEVAQYGDNCLLVTEKPIEALEGFMTEISDSCIAAGVSVHRFAGVVPNPTTVSVNEGVAMAKKYHANVIVGIGGGSAMDTAKAIAVGVSHPGEAWDYRLNQKDITEATLPILAITTTSGTGSEVTAVSVVTNAEEELKYALFSHKLFPRVSIIDPELTLTVPPHVKASTGFDAFCHSFESTIHSGNSPYVDMHAFESIRLVKTYLKRAIDDPKDIEARTALAWANTLGGLSIANAGTTLPHGIGMAIGGHAPFVMHGEALAIVYPAILDWTWDAAIPQFAKAARIFNPGLASSTDAEAAKSLTAEVIAFQKEIGMDLSFKSKGVAQSVLPLIADDTMKLPDYTVHPKVADRDFYLSLIEKSYDR